MTTRITVNLFSARNRMGTLRVAAGSQTHTCEVSSLVDDDHLFASPWVGTYMLEKHAPVQRGALEAREAYGNEILIFAPANGDRSHVVTIHGGEDVQGELPPTDGGLRVRDADLSVIAALISSGGGPVELEIVEEKVDFISRLIWWSFLWHLFSKRSNSTLPFVPQRRDKVAASLHMGRTGQIVQTYRADCGMSAVDWYVWWYLMEESLDVGTTNEAWAFDDQVQPVIADPFSNDDPNWGGVGGDTGGGGASGSYDEPVPNDDAVGVAAVGDEPAPNDDVVVGGSAPVDDGQAAAPVISNWGVGGDTGGGGASGSSGSDDSGGTSGSGGGDSPAY